MLGRDLLSAPLAMTISCAGAWFLYMLLSAVLARAGHASENALRNRQPRPPANLGDAANSGEPRSRRAMGTAFIAETGVAADLR